MHMLSVTGTCYHLIRIRAIKIFKYQTLYEISQSEELIAYLVLELEAIGFSIEIY